MASFAFTAAFVLLSFSVVLARPLQGEEVVSLQLVRIL